MSRRAAATSSSSVTGTNTQHPSLDRGSDEMSACVVRLTAGSESAASACPAARTTSAVQRRSSGNSAAGARPLSFYASAHP